MQMNSIQCNAVVFFKMKIALREAPFGEKVPILIIIDVLLASEYFQHLFLNGFSSHRDLFFTSICLASTIGSP
jgi:hypothetical protein